MIGVGQILDALDDAVWRHVYRRLDDGIDVPQNRRVIIWRRADERHGRGMEVPHRAAFAQEFRIAVIREALAVAQSRLMFENRYDPVVRGSGRDRRTHDDEMRGRLPA